MKFSVATVLLLCTLFVLVDDTSAWFGPYGGWSTWRRGNLYNGWYNWRWSSWATPWSVWNSYFNYDTYNPWYWGRRSTLEVDPKLECTYLDNRSLLKCFTANATVECEAYGNFARYESNYFNFYAVGVRTNCNLTNSSALTYPLYPQLVDGRTWLNSTYFDTELGRNLTYMIYYNLNTTFNGIRVVNETCYGLLVNLLNGFGFNETIIVGTDNVFQTEIVGGLLSA